MATARRGVRRVVILNGHGGDAGTSLHLRPDTVDMGAARDFRSSAEVGAIPPTGPVTSGWIASDLNSHGVVGEAHLATAEKVSPPRRSTPDCFT